LHRLDTLSIYIDQFQTLNIHMHTNIFECCVIFTNATHVNEAKMYIQNNIKMY
jgi:hypothetical protein